MRSSPPSSPRCTNSLAYETNVESGDKLDYHQGHAYWHQWFVGLERGREALHGNRRELCRYLWKTWAPTRDFTAAEFNRTAALWDNPAWVDVTLHSYRVRWDNASADPRYAKWEARLKTHLTITVPTVLLHGERDGASLAMSSEGQERAFNVGDRRAVLPGAGHFLPRERPNIVINTILDKQSVGQPARRPRGGVWIGICIRPFVLWNHVPITRQARPPAI